MNQAANPNLNVEASAQRVQETYEKQHQAYLANPYPEYEERLANLQKLENILKNNRVAITEAINKDYGNRSIHETEFLELFGSIDGIKYCRKQLKSWMKPQKRHTSIWFFGGKNKVLPQPKGVVGIVVPWNYPLFLCMSPLANVLAAGNRAMIKMAANSQNLCRLLADLVNKEFGEDTLAILPGVSASDFTDMPYDHLVFTGSPNVGRQVMEKASKHLTPVTLELGGKSPCIVAEDYDIELACERILQGKLYNAGQTCVAPDYVFLPESKADAFIEHAKKIVPQRYPNLETKDFTSIIDKRAYSRLIQTLDDAKEKGAQVVNLLGDVEPSDELEKIPPTLILDSTTEMTVMQEEIFGPIMPVKTYRDINEVIEFINIRERPLALYLFSKNKPLQDKVIKNTISGGVSLNDVMMHVAQHDIPFGGVGNSGMGHYHGKEGFIEFSKLRPIFQQAPSPGTKYMVAPFGKTMDFMLRMMLGKR
ncbi:coniferyl aldehyde dehydrogenase [uncultured Pseudoteredinibacter sp.]|uniref:coniferyl aldehyde dehydrogenase n=1 Tax=uncultured Pseudoteredinibacter sp. TaxID=1641701 RepID=UPI00260BAE3F|nr:coniferyl aldehyde dehydrogenase [uncultured Pseudoteredinibacter sp.]